MSAILLGLYEAAKKDAVAKNAVPVVLFASVCCGACIWSVIFVLSRLLANESSYLIQIESLTWNSHVLIMVKSIITATSWMLAYTSMKTLPLSIASPLRSTGPIWTITFATLLFGERPSPLQWWGLLIILIALFAFSLVGRREGINFRKHRGVWLMVAGTIIGAISGLYDKFLIQSVHISPEAVQTWFSIYLVPVMTPTFLYWRYRQSQTDRFEWRRSIPAIAILLLLADFAYFRALSYPDALVSIISPVRRLSVVVALALGILHFKETQAIPKSICVATMIFGVILLSLG